MLTDEDEEVPPERVNYQKRLKLLLFFTAFMVGVTLFWAVAAPLSVYLFIQLTKEP